MQHLSVARTSPDCLTMETWRFWFDDRRSRLVLDCYTMTRAATKRHKHNVAALWETFDPRNNTITEPPFPDDVREEALATFRASITCGMREQ